MISELHETVYTVHVTNAEVCAFARSWPCHNLDTDGEYLFEFDRRNGDLVAVDAVTPDGGLRQIAEEEDGGWLSALCDDAMLEGAEDLGLSDVIAIRYGDTRSAAL